MYTCIILNLIDCKKYKINLQVIEKNHQKRNLAEKQNYLKLLRNNNKPSEWWKSTKKNISDNSCCPNINFQTISVIKKINLNHGAPIPLL